VANDLIRRCQYVVSTINLPRATVGCEKKKSPQRINYRKSHRK